MYFGVLAVGFIGALVARFRPHGMARALFTMAITQMLVPVIALLIAKPQNYSGTTGRSGSIWSQCILRHAVCRIGFAVSTRKHHEL